AGPASARPASTGGTSGSPAFRPPSASPVRACRTRVGRALSVRTEALSVGVKAHSVRAFPSS
ncbi:hypothetical protein, partial [Streptomyces sp. CO7]